VVEHLSAQGLEAVHLAEEQAREMGHEYLGTEHLLLGLLAQEATSAAGALRSLGVQLAQVRSEVERMLGLGEGPGVGSIRLTPLATRALERAVAQARTVGHDLASCEHLLLGLAEERDGLAARILLRLDVSLEQVRTELAGQAGARGDSGR
jgi:ATP-dependent Clp protease ATP-binding subunit ClpC